MRKNLVSRLERLEQRKEAEVIPALIVVMRAEGESVAECRRRTLADMRITDRPGLPFVAIDPEDATA